MNYLLDTCVISEAWKRKPHAEVMAWLEKQTEQNLFLCSLTIGELTKGIARRQAGARRNRLWAWVSEALPARFQGRILSIDIEIVARWGIMLAEAEMRGDILPVIDGLIAATAAYHDLTVCTRNEEDFVRCRVPVFNPWKSHHR